MMRAENEVFRDKVEITLEGRQVFYLFFGGAVIASLVFVLGVMVGKRVEARAHVGESTAGTTASSDPLAALDELGPDPGAAPELTYQAELSKPMPPPPAPPPVPVVVAPRPEDKPSDKPADKPADEQPQPKKKFALQISSFRDKPDADAMVKSLTQAGYSPYITEAEVEGKGTWYRVRIGTYETYDAANEAKDKFEAAQKMTAYVSRVR
ncbi:MAG TPA: SPOR domain-containing protein [Kofleriaceae bacterium]|jgi:cell division septation protein DedD|nr:SPOR domain-containing protein [Kofleriaceae bacterium]